MSASGRRAKIPANGAAKSTTIAHEIAKDDDMSANQRLIGNEFEETDVSRKIDKTHFWEIIADNLKKAGWSLGYVSAIDSNGGTIWIADAHRGDGKRFIVHADEKLTAFVELESVIRAVSL
jgi:hypothetical protein